MLSVMTDVYDFMLFRKGKRLFFSEGLGQHSDENKSTLLSITQQLPLINSTPAPLPSPLSHTANNPAAGSLP